MKTTLRAALVLIVCVSATACFPDSFSPKIRVVDGGGDAPNRPGSDTGVIVDTIPGQEIRLAPQQK